ENYLKQTPARTVGLQGPDQEIKTLELMQKASESISDADMVDVLLRGAEQHWSLMPLHACLSLVRPASFMYGQASNPGWGNSASFPQWLGQNSKQNKLQRTLGDIQAKMRMKVSGDKTEIRRQYIPALAPQLVDPLGQGKVFTQSHFKVERNNSSFKDNIQNVIDIMDAYYLSREDWDTIVELGVGDRSETSVLKGIPTATKTAFTRTQLTHQKSYNGADHPIAFHKGTDLGAPIKKIAAKDVPDVEEAFDIDDEVPEDEEDVKPKAKDTGINDKLVKEGKAKATKDTKGKSTSKEAKKV
ncbi:11766_t:CDS:2, partial [Acaulospora colombiana]